MTISNDDNIDASTLDLKELTMLRTPMGKSDGLMPTQVQERIMKMPGRKKMKMRRTGFLFIVIQFLMRSARMFESFGAAQVQLGSFLSSSLLWRKGSLIIL